MSTQPAELQIRSYHPEDAVRLRALFLDTIRRVNARDYSPEQIRAWASDEIDPDGWSARFTGRFAVVAEWDAQIAGFGELEPDGHLDRRSWLRLLATQEDVGLNGERDALIQESTELMKIFAAILRKSE